LFGRLGLSLRVLGSGSAAGLPRLWSRARGRPAVAPRRFRGPFRDAVDIDRQGNRRSTFDDGAHDAGCPAAVEKAAPAQRPSHPVRGGCSARSSPAAIGRDRGRSGRALGDGADRLAGGDVTGNRNPAGSGWPQELGAVDVHDRADAGLDDGAIPARDRVASARPARRARAAVWPLGCGISGARPIDPGERRMARGSGPG
jgi:hypothetical protein